MTAADVDLAALRTRIRDLHQRRYDVLAPDPSIVTDAEALGNPAALFEALVVHSGALLFVDQMDAGRAVGERALELLRNDPGVAEPHQVPSPVHLFNRLGLFADWRGELVDTYRMAASGLVVARTDAEQDMALCNLFAAEVALGIVGPATELFAASGWRADLRPSNRVVSELNVARMLAAEGNLAEATRRLLELIDHDELPDYMAFLFATWAATFALDIGDWYLVERTVGRIDALVDTMQAPPVGRGQVERYLLRAGIALSAGEPAAAIEIVDEIDAMPGVGAESRARAILIRAAATLEAGDPRAAVEQLDRFDRLFDIPPEHLRLRYYCLRCSALEAGGDFESLVEVRKREIVRLARPQDLLSAAELLGPQLAVDLEHVFDLLKERLVGRLRWERAELVEAITHDLASALGVVRLGTGLIDSHSDRVVPALQAATHRMRTIVDTFALLVSIDHSRLRPTLERHRFGTLVEQVVANMQPAANDKQIELVYDAGPPAEVTVLADPGFFEMALANVIGNAVKYSPAGTTVTVEVGDRDHPGVVSVAVIDQGPGLSPDELEVIFSRHVRGAARPTGSETSLGLGLYISRAMCALLGGRVRADSRGVGTGSTFTITLPEHDDESEPA